MHIHNCKIRCLVIKAKAEIKIVWKIIQNQSEICTKYKLYNYNMSAQYKTKKHKQCISMSTIQ